MKKTSETPLRVALFKESVADRKMWVAQCLDYDIVAQGETIASAKESFKKTVIAHVCIALHKGEEPFVNIQVTKAPDSELPRQSVRLTPARMLRRVSVSYAKLTGIEREPVI
ncbi:MAG: hypothetical protein L0Z50_40525 [Verrucomicrobiales bacterium]|nr:hypothetical protein [Verrucomicrobiales bacterium]